MKWLKCIEHIAKYNVPDKCPYCKSKRTAYNATKVKDNFGYAVVWCNECKKAHIISRIKIDDNTITYAEVPNDLTFT